MHAIETEREFLVRQGFEVGGSPDVSDPAAAWRAHAATVAGVLAEGGVARPRVHRSSAWPPASRA